MSTANSRSASSLAPSGPVDFKVYSSGMQTYGWLDTKSGVITRAADGQQYPYLDDLVKLVAGKEFGKLADLPVPVVQMVGSSTDQDLDGDVMYATALADMTKVEDRLSICLNHSYNLPEDLYGSLVQQPWTRSQGGITDLYLQSDVAVINPRAAQTFLYTAQGRRIGVSGGFCVLEAEWIDRKSLKPLRDDQVDMYDVIEGKVTLGIKHVKAVEWSTVTIPSNQRSWVEGAVKGYFARTFDPKVASIVKASLSQADYNRLIVQAPTAEQRKALEDVLPRKVAAPTARRIYWNPLDETFTLGSGQQIQREHVVALLKSGIGPITYYDVNGVRFDENGVRLASDPASDPEVTKAADGGDGGDGGDGAEDTDHPDKKAQQARSKKYGIGIKDGGHVTKPGEFAEVPESEWADPVNWRYPMHDKAHADNAASRWGDAGNRSQYSDKEQGIISRRIEARQRHFGEETSDKSVTAVVAPVHGEEPTGASSEASNNAMQTKAGRGSGSAAHITIHDDGSHEAFTGTHTHAHKAFGTGDGDMHDHEHTHKDDATHRHNHTGVTLVPADGKDGSDAIDNSKGRGGSGSGAKIEIAADGSHEAFTGIHTHSHKAFGNQGDDGMHEHQHEHKSDADHHHSHAALDGKDGADALDKTAAGGQSGEPAGTPSSPNVPIADSGEHAPMTGRHSHKHAAYGMADGDGGGFHSHEHEHNSDGDHGHDHLSAAMGPNAKSSTAVLDLSTPDPERDLFLSTYRHIAGKYGLPSITTDGKVDMSKCNLVETAVDAQHVLSLVSEADVYSDALSGTIDKIMKQLGVRDIDAYASATSDGDTTGGDNADGSANDGTSVNGDGEGGEPGSGGDADLLLPSPSYPMYRQQSLDATMRMMIKLFGVAKAGARNSKEDRATIQMIHDAASRLTDGEVCKAFNDNTRQDQGDNTPAEGGAGSSEQDARDEEAGKGGSMGANTHSGKAFLMTDPDLLTALPDLLSVSKTLSEALGGLKLAEYAEALETQKLKLASISKAVASAEQRAAQVAQEAAALRGEVQALGNAPLPRPTALNRSLDMSDAMTRDAVATYGDMARVNAANAANQAALDAGVVPGDGQPLTLKQALALTDLVEVDGITYRHWPAGIVPLGGRPELTNEQKMLTRSAQQYAYAEGHDAYINVRGERLPE